jgi:hypothetical protein
MDTAITIQDFNALLKSEQDDSPLLKLLRQLTALKKPDDVRMLEVGPQYAWMAWSSPPPG